MKLRHNNTLSTVDNKGALVGHVRDRTKIHILNHSCKILMVRICAIQLQFGLQRHTIGESALQTLLDGVFGWVNIIVEKLEHEIIAGVRNGEVLGKYFVKPLVVTFLRRSVQLQEILERLELNLQKVGIRKRILNRRKIYTGFG